MIILREINGLLWWEHDDGLRYRLHGHDLWIECFGNLWGMRREGGKQPIPFRSRDEAMAYVVEALNRYGEPGALPLGANPGTWPCWEHGVRSGQSARPRASISAA